MAPRRKPTAVAVAAAASEKNTKRLKKSNNGQVDLISELPDSILHHILSFLDMKYVIPTSFLSRRWRYLWTSLPYLNISDEVYDHCKKPVESLEYDEYEEEPEKKKTDFTDFVDRVLLMRDQRSDISSCRFSYNDTSSNIDEQKILGDIYLWIHVLIRSNVQVFDLHIGSSPEQLNLPHCLFNCKSVTTLKLDMGPEDIDVCGEQPKCNLPTELGMNLPALRVLQFRFLSIVGDVGKLISSCPVLETFVISKCVVNLCGKQLNISASQLKKLVIEEIDDDRSETGSLEYCKLKVFAPKLTSFMSRDSPINDYTFVETSSLVNAEITDEYARISYYYDEGKKSDWCITRRQYYLKHLIKCLGGIHNVRSLTLSAWLLIMVITEAPTGFRSLPMDPFCNLRLLNLKTSLSRREIHGITCLLEKCPNSETLVLKMVECQGIQSVSRGEYVWEGKLEPQCMMDHLKLVEIWDILTSVNELEFLKFLLKNATVLEKMIVHTPKNKLASDNIKLKIFGEKLKTFPAASSMTGISFLSDAKPREPDADLPIGRLLVYGGSS